VEIEVGFHGGKKGSESFLHTSQTAVPFLPVVGLDEVVGQADVQGAYFRGVECDRGLLFEAVDFDAI